MLAAYRGDVGGDRAAEAPSREERRSQPERAHQRSDVLSISHTLV
jgi:hypothetical protein